MKTKPIIGHLTAINSKRDIYANCYWSFTYVDAHTGKVIHAVISGTNNNISTARRYISNGEKEFNDGNHIHYEEREMGIREFNKYVKNWDYAGCTPEDIASYIKRELRKKD